MEMHLTATGVTCYMGSVSPVTGHKWTYTALTPVVQPAGWYTIYLPRIMEGGVEIGDPLQ